MKGDITRFPPANSPFFCITLECAGLHPVAGQARIPNSSDKFLIS